VGEYDLETAIRTILHGRCACGHQFQKNEIPDAKFLIEMAKLEEEVSKEFIKVLSKKSDQNKKKKRWGLF
jgi:hypothetical protein